MARVGRTHAQALQARLRARKQLNANGPIAPQILAPQPAWCAKRAARAIADPPGLAPQTLISAWNLLDCHGT
jgi:hypothetical protein